MHYAESKNGSYDSPIVFLEKSTGSPYIRNHNWRKKRGQSRGTEIVNHMPENKHHNVYLLEVPKAHSIKREIIAQKTV